MSAPFIGAYSWTMLLGRSGIITEFLNNYFGLDIGSIYGFRHLAGSVTQALPPRFYLHEQAF